MISLIAVIGKNNAIGYDNKLIWDIPDDLKYFKKITTGHPVIMGRKTYESIGRPLPNRKNIIITRDEKYQVKNCQVFNSLDDIIKKYKDNPEEVFVIGGGQIYKQALPSADKLYLTIVDDNPQADTFFPDYSEFKIIKKQNKSYHNIKYSFNELNKK